MPSFDVVNELDWHEVSNAVDQANRELTTRYDFKGVDAKFVVKDKAIIMEAQFEPQLQQMFEMLFQKMVKRGIDLKTLERADAVLGNMRASQSISVKEGIEAPAAKKMVKLIKDAKIKVQAQIQGEQLRVTGKKRDDLQQVMALLKGADLDVPVQFTNFRD